MEAERTKKFQTRESIYKSAFYIPTLFLLLFLFMRIYQTYPVIHAVKNSATILQTHTTLNKTLLTVSPLTKNLEMHGHRIQKSWL